MLYKGFVRFLRTDGKRPGPWLCATVAVPCPRQAGGLARRAVRATVRDTAEICVLPYHLEPMPKVRKR